MPFHIFPLTAGDAQPLCKFYNSLSMATIRTFRPLGDKTTPQVCSSIAERNEGKPRLRYDLLARDADRIAGWAFLEQMNSQQPQLGIVVEEAVQGRGLGKLLLGRLLVWARERRLRSVYLVVVKDNVRAIHLYHSHGFVICGEEFDEQDQLPYFHMVADLSTSVSA